MDRFDQLLATIIDRRSADVIIDVFYKPRTAVDSDIPLAITGH